MCLPEKPVRLSLNSFLPSNEAGGTVEMTEMLFKDKEFVYNHHLAVPHRPLVPDAGKSVGTPDLGSGIGGDVGDKIITSFFDFEYFYLE